VISKHTGKTQVVTKDWFNFSYDSSKLFEKEFYLVDATFNLKKIDDYQAAYAKGRKIEIIRHRNNRYPTERSCGSFFRNFLDHEVPFTIKGKKILAVAYYLDKLGIKGDLSVGKAIVFYKHANMIVSQDGATSENILQLARTIQELTKEKFGIVPTPECQFIGFNTTDKIVNVTYSTTTL
jgi:UDP-N-acetylenolpyruvoylglucosamine reductase